MDEFSDGYAIHQYPKQSKEWKCLLFGSKDDSGIVYMPPEDGVPNWFVRWMMKVCLGCTWVKTKKEN